MSRRLTNIGPVRSHKPEPFHAFMKGLTGKVPPMPLRVLVIGANVDRTIPAAEAEATAVARQIETDARQLGVACELQPLVGSQATHSAVTEALRSEQWHIIHYAGHGLFDPDVTDASGLLVAEGDAERVLSATDLRMLLNEKDVRLVFLNCCYGARTGQLGARNDVAGMLNALGQADVPNAISYRWSVADERAKALALHFYSALFTTFSPGESLLRARQAAAMDIDGFDDDTWASPILLEQAS